MSAILDWLRPVCISLLFCVLGGMCNAAMDKSFAHYDRSVFSTLGDPNYYDPRVSWKKKWALDAAGEPIPGKERFLWSSTLLVPFTDFWHLAKMGMLTCIFAAMIAYRRGPSALWEKGADFALLFTAFTGTFTLFFDCLLLR